MEETENEKEMRPTLSKREVEHEQAIKNPIAATISTLIHKLRDFEECADKFLPAASQMRVELLTGTARQIKDALSLIKSQDQHTRVVGIKQALDWTRKSERAIHSDPERVLRESLFMGMFSAFDAFSGDLMRAVFQKKPALFRCLNRTVTISEVLECSTLDDLKRSLIEDEIESFRRESYVDQFTRLESLFGINLRAFSHWTDFVERAQRRNIFTHCDGIVTDQYVSTCSSVGARPTGKVGERLDISSEYLEQSVELLMEVGLKLGQTLWRKIFPDELSESDASLNHEIYNLLHDEKWARAFVFSEFAIQQPKASSDQMAKIFTVNHVIAAKFGDKESQAATILSSLDWSGAAPEFRLAKAVLEARFEDAAALMLQIGRSSELVSEHSYHTFPLFRAFRLQDSFLCSYEKIFGHPFTAKVQETADVTQTQLEASAEQGEKDIVSGNGHVTA